ncbi:MAG: 2,3-bisphosphoglycerate-independent phosphoglycerate mutase [Methylotenera sp.]|nr:2,3-bisphosphoglycerate-independent phosphoglycerate mutase [Methylotenera sp.]MDO9389594.1 2,3-bisphosphoglycerate-independent phosphoglycerate mutase [Methylotenera sp.]MDP2101028.1 2,3-bisphosphoglycerate-independent phosphoglycerate mutase [Methylotenera sp.]MDP2280397.1 2,3-bisphosphoglycerate-independent phosphoglycerate mutase [Methylotenera sp.]MDP2402656.1 2,3-bisphosphoglycerate-independent phosphoglycerate mutase [Methylotenera sp.]
MSTSTTITNTTPVCLLILDGFGYREEMSDNAIAQAKKPNWDTLWKNFPHTLINASEHYVGLPDGQMGNSEVGHLNIGAGRVVFQDFERINNSIASGEFFDHAELKPALLNIKNNQKALHIFGLLSNGGVHSHQDHIHAMLKMAAKHGLSKVYIHAFLDGRDTPPVSAAPFIETLEQQCKTLGVGKIASISGRFYGMDRDKRWPRVEAAYKLFTEGVGEFMAETAAAGLQNAYARGENDEFVKTTAIRRTGEAPVHLEDGDLVVFMNFRSDRARQLTHALLAEDFDGFHRRHLPKLVGYFTLTMYDKKETKATALFPPQEVRNTFGEYLSNLGLTQLRIAETEKYPHVTFFFNGGEETVFAGEDRILVPSPQVETYDLQPEMSAYEVTERLEEAILSQKYNAIICNYANCDMVGHSGNLGAAITAVETLDTCIGRVVNAMQSIGGEVLITADHGNAELMYDVENQQPHTQHTTNLVPLIYIGREATLNNGGALSDLAPTLLHMMGLTQPDEMTGKNLAQVKV